MLILRVSKPDGRYLGTITLKQRDNQPVTLDEMIQAARAYAVEQGMVAQHEADSLRFDVAQ